MSKLSFRARALDPSKPLNIHVAEELPDLTEYSAINRAVPQMPSGMEKEEESEHHLQRAICTGLIIPTPEVFDIDSDFYNRIYPEDFKVSRQLIRMQPLGIEQDIPDYDMDSADEAWISSQSNRFDLSPLKFEEMMDRLEKSSGQTVVNLNEAKALLKQDDEISIAVYDYWLSKRLATQHPLILTIKTENRAGSAVNNPYIAFRRRTEKMQTRKNRKNDETSYEKMLKLKRNLSRAVTLLEMIKRREKTKREHVHLGIEIFEKRYQAKDYNGFLLAEFTNNAVKASRSAFTPLYGNQYSGQQSNQYWPNSSSHYSGSSNAAGVPSSLLNKHGNNDIDGSLHNNRKEKRQYKKRKHKNQREKQTSGSTVDHLASSDEDEPIINLNHLGHDTENEGMYPFRRNSGNQYHRPLLNDYGKWPWETKTDHSAKYRFTLTSIRHPRVRCIGFARRRRGRGGRIVLDRIATNMDEFWANLDYTIYSGNTKITAKELCRQNELKRQQQLQLSADIVRDKSASVVIDLDVANQRQPQQKSIAGGFGGSDEMKMENIVIKTEEKTTVTLNESLDSVNRTRNNNTNAIIGKNIDSNKANKNVNVNTNASATPPPLPMTPTSTAAETITNRNNGTVNTTNTDNNNNSGNNNSKNINNRNSSNSRFSNMNNMFRHPLNVSGNNVRRHFNVPPNSSSLDLSPSSSASISSPSASSSMPSSSSAYFANVFDGHNSNFTHDGSANVRLTAAAQSHPHQRNSSYNNLYASNRLATVGREACSSRNHISDCTTNDFLSEDVSVTNQLYSELFGDWLHYRPKTPDDDFDVYTNFGEDFPQFAENTSLTVDIQRLTDCDNSNGEAIKATTSNTSTTTIPNTVVDEKIDSSKPSMVLDQTVDNTFTTNPFSYEYLATSSAASASPIDDDDSSSVEELNMSGDSLPGLTLSLGDNEANEKAIDTLLEECKFDDLKSINPNANFWNGLLDENGSLLDVIDNKKQASNRKDSDIIDETTELGLGGAIASTTNLTDRKSVRRKSTNQQQRIGHSMFNVVNLHEHDNIFIKNEVKDATSKSKIPSATGTNSEGNNPNIDPALAVKKEIIDMEVVESTSAAPASALVNTSIAEIQIKDEPMDETIAQSTENDHGMQVRQIVPVIKTEIGNNVPVVSNAALPRPITIQQATQLQQQQQQQQQSHQPQFATNDQTLILSSRPIRRLTANGPADGKTGIQHLLINRNRFQMIQQRSVGDDDKTDVKPKILEGAYLKLPGDFNVVSSNALTTINASSATSKHNYSLPPQAAFHHQPITLIGQSQQSQNKVGNLLSIDCAALTAVNDRQRNCQIAHIGSTNLALATQSMQDVQKQITIPTSNIKLNIVPSLAQVMQSTGGSLVIDAKSVTNAGDIRITSRQGDITPINTLTQCQSDGTGASTSEGVPKEKKYGFTELSNRNHNLISFGNDVAPNAAQIHYQQSLQQQLQQQQQQQHQTQQIQTVQPKVKLEKGSVNMYDSDRTRILYTNLKNNRSGAQFLAQLNPSKVVNIVPIQHKSNAGGGTKTIQRVVVSSSQSQNQQLATAFRQSTNANSANTLLATNSGNLLNVGTASVGTGNVTNTNSNNLIGSGNTLIITTSSASDPSSIIFNDINTTAMSSTNVNSISTNANSNQTTINLSNLTKVTGDKLESKLNHNDGSVVSAAATTANVTGNTINR